MTSPRYILQSAVFLALDDDLDNSVRVTDSPDMDTPCPFCDIGNSDVFEGDDKTAEDYEGNMKIRVVTSATDAKGNKENSDIQWQVFTRLTKAPLDLGAEWRLNFVITNNVGAVDPSEDGQYYISELSLTFNFQKI